MQIYVHVKLSTADQEAFQSLLPECRIEFTNGNAQEFTAIIANSEVIVGNVPPGWIAGAQKLQLIQTDSAGIDNYLGLDWPELGQKVRLSNVGDFYATPVAEEVLSALLLFYKQQNIIFKSQEQRVWNKDEIRARKKTLTGKTITLLGYGRIAKRLRGFLQVFDCKIQIFSHRDFYQKGLAYFYQLLDKSDALISILPASPETNKIVGKTAFNHLGTGGIFINVGRGATVDEEELILALDNGRLAGAYLDVTEEEPLQPESPLWATRNLILSQHGAGGMEQENLKKMTFIAKCVQKYLTSGDTGFLIDMTGGRR